MRQRTRGASASTTSSAMLATTTSASSVPVRASSTAASTRDAVSRHVLACDLDGDRVGVAGAHRREAEPCRSDGDDARAAADVEQAAAARARRAARARAASSGATPVPKARPGSITIASASAGGAPTAGRPRAGRCGPAVWKRRQASSQPGATCSTVSVGNAAPRAAPSLPPVGRSAGRARRRARRPRPPREPRRDELEEQRDRGLLAASRRHAVDARRGAPSGTRSSACGRTPRRRRVVRLGAGRLAEAAQQVALLLGQAARDGDVDAHVLVAAAEALQHRHALAAQRCGPGPAACPARTRARSRRRASAP